VRKFLRYNDSTYGVQIFAMETIVFSGRRLSKRCLAGTMSSMIRRTTLFFAFLALMVCCAATVVAETCTTSGDMEPATRTALVTAGQRYFDFLAKGDAASMRQSAIPSLAADFSGIETTVKDNQTALAGSKATARPPFLLEANGTAPIPRAEFYCGVFGKNGQTADSAAFYLNGLPPGKYGVVILDVSSKTAYTVSMIVQQQASEWKLGGLYIKAAEIGGYNGDWYIARARDFQAKGQVHNAWLYYVEARSLVSPLPFMSTATTDKLYDESQKSQPADLPADGKTVDLTAGASTYKVTALFPEMVGNDLDLIVKYQAADVSNTNQAYQSNITVMKTLVTKYPELRNAFAAVVARAVDPGGRDYGTMLAMKDIK
jgi:hypothetical protein